LPEKNIFVTAERRGWREQPPVMENFTSLNGKIVLTGPKEVWTKGNALDEDETGELFLHGTYRGGEKDNRKNALLLIFTMEKKDKLQDAVKAVREYLDKKKDDKSYKIFNAAELVPGQADNGSLETIGEKRGHRVDLKLQFNDEPKTYYLLAVINDPDICYAILCECSWESRQIWRQDFLDVLASLRAKKE
jgi:hypothetical protein